MNRLTLFIALGVAPASVLAQDAMYRPLGEWADTQHRSAAIRSIRPSDRPQLSQVLPRHIELLEDGLRRKYPKRLGDSPAKARQMINRMYRANRGILHGAMAEAMFIDRHPRWGYVSKPNASQHDVYRWVPGRRTPFTGQLKFHISGNPALYARDMLRDHRSNWFAVPDDHVSALKGHLRQQQAWTNYYRVRGLGATSRDIVRATKAAARLAASERHAGYMPLGAALALSLGPGLWDWAKGETSVQSFHGGSRALSLVAAGWGADSLLRAWRKGIYRGTARGHAFAAATMMIAELGWQVHDHGWRQAFYRPQFYEEAAGGISSLALGVLGFAWGTSVASPTGPWAPWIGTGIGFVTASVGYFGGRHITRLILEWLSPEMLRQREREQFAMAKESIDRRIREAQTWPPPG